MAGDEDSAHLLCDQDSKSLSWSHGGVCSQTRIENNPDFARNSAEAAFCHLTPWCEPIEFLRSNRWHFLFWLKLGWYVISGTTPMV